MKQKLPFIGRSFELSQLRSLEQLKIASLVVVQGRRRVGKSRLIQEFGKNKTFYEFSGLIAEKQTTAQTQREQFAYQYKSQLKKPLKDISDWSAIFAQLANITTNKKIVILFDEISWMGSLDPDFIGKFKIAWDLYFSKNKDLIFVLCGSISSWIYSNILSNTAFFGRINLLINLQELSLQESCKFLRNKKESLAPSEMLKILSITGGIPRYLELINTSISAEDNIKNLCFQPNATLLNEYNRIFTDIFGNRSAVFENIVKSLQSKPLTLEQIASKLRITKSTDLIKKIELLCQSGFLAEDFTWDISKRKMSNLRKYRLKDNYLRFYLKYLKPNEALIKQGGFKFQSLYKLRSIEIILGLQFENLVINCSNEIFKEIGIEKEDVVFSGPYFQRSTTRKNGCQIDYLIQTKKGNVFLCEIKNRRDAITSDVIKEVKKKYSSIKKIRNVTYRFILISAGVVNNSVYDSDFFDKIITFEDMVSR